MAGELPGAMRIGDVLREARERAGLDLRDASDETKIRLRYLSALEDERWEDLPSPAYAKGFLRTYAQLLGLDGDALTDEYRRQVEGIEAQEAYPLGEGVLERRRRPGEPEGPRFPRWEVVAVIVASLVAALVGIGLLVGGDDSEQGPREKRAGKARPAGKGGGSGGGKAKPEGEVTLSLHAREAVEVCLTSGGRALIDRQVLAAGSRDEFRRPRFSLRFPTGFAPRQIELKLDGVERRLPPADGPAAYDIVAPKRIEAVEPPKKEGCP